jgi:hypothetical protein
VLGVVDAEEVQHRGVEIVDGDFVFRASFPN